MKSFILKCQGETFQHSTLLLFLWDTEKSSNRGTGLVFVSFLLVDKSTNWIQIHEPVPSSLYFSSKKKIILSETFARFRL